MIAVPFIILFLIAVAIGYSSYKARAIEQAFPNVGELTDVGGFRMNAVHLPRPAGADLPPLVFIHGASGNLRDQLQAFEGPLRTRAEMLFVDRPGHVPFVGWLFSHAFVIPAGLRRLEQGTIGVFRPNARPAGYVEKTAPALVLRPDAFRNNAADVANLLAYVKTEAPRYREISAPTVIITGDSDDIVLEELHSRGLARDIADAELVTIHNLGHKPDYIATDVAIAALERLAGSPRDLQRIARRAEKRIAGILPAT